MGVCNDARGRSDVLLKGSRPIQGLKPQTIAIVTNPIAIALQPTKIGSARHCMPRSAMASFKVDVYMRIFDVSSGWPGMEAFRRKSMHLSGQLPFIGTHVGKATDEKASYIYM